MNQIPTSEGARRAGFNIQPYFLQDETDKRYPPKPEIAKKLLKQGHDVWLMKRSINMYWYEHEPMPKLQTESQGNSVSPERVWIKPEYPISQNEVFVPTPSTPIQSDVPIKDLVPFPKNPLKSEPMNVPEPPPKRSIRFYKKPLWDHTDEWLAQKVYKATGILQEIEARQLVDKYGRKAVGQALGRMEFMRDKGDLQNLAGFMKVVSRVCWLAINGFNTPKPEYQAPKKRKPRKPAYNLKNDPIWQSEAYRDWCLSFEAAPMDIWEVPSTGNGVEW